MITSEHFTGSSETSLDLIGDQQDVILGAEISDLLQVSIFRDNNATFSLDGLDTDGADVGVRLEHPLKVFRIVVLEQFKALSERTKLGVSRRVVTSS